jgi:hypothetical protein
VVAALLQRSDRSSQGRTGVIGTVLLEAQACGVPVVAGPAGRQIVVAVDPAACWFRRAGRLCWQCRGERATTSASGTIWRRQPLDAILARTPRSPRTP